MKLYKPLRNHVTVSPYLERGQQSLGIQIGMVRLNGKGGQAWEKQNLGVSVFHG